MRVTELRKKVGKSVEILIIGAGPAGSVAAALLRQQGRQVLVLEREQFPRFSIGESLLPQSMEYLEQGGMLRAVVEAGFQLKNGAAFARGQQYSEFDFNEKYSPGWSTTYQVPRSRFDHLLALEAEARGAEVRYRHEVVAVDIDGSHPRVEVKNFDGDHYLVQAQFILDASGFGRILPRLLQLETPSNFPLRGAIFAHIEDRITQSGFDRNKILVGLKKDCKKRPISIGTIEAVTDRIEKRIQEMGETEIESRVVGEEVMKELHQLDQVAYVRFASVYREFKDIDQFMDELKTLAQQRRER